MAHPSQNLPGLSPLEASAILREPVYSVAPLGQGGRSRVYRVETEDGAVRVLRLTPKGSGRVAREAWVRAQLGRNPDAPVPAQLVVTNTPVADLADIVSMAELPGTTMYSAQRSLFEPEVQALYHQFGAGLATIHNVPSRGFGLLNGAGVGAHASWREAFAALTEAALDEARISAMGDLLDRARETIARLAPRLPEPSASLTHGDAQPMNVQVHRGRIVAFLDFEFASGADPLYELAYVEPLFEPATTPGIAETDLAARRAAFYAGYASRRELPAADPSLTRLYRLVHALRGTEFLSVVGPQLAAPARAESVTTARAGLARWLED